MSNSSTGIDAVRRTHARILTGGTDSARKHRARQWAAAVFCTNSGDAACAVCGACKKVYDGMHPDVLTLRCDSAHIKIEDVRALRRDLQWMPNEGPTRVVIIEDADALNVYAQNALLNVLEEGGSVFFLLCETPEILLPTVRSRCALERLPAETPDEAEECVDVRRLTAALAQRDDWLVLRRCYALQKMKRDAFGLFLDALCQALLEDMKAQMRPDGRREALLPPAASGRIIDECRVMRHRLTQNVAVPHLCGRLAVLLTQSGG